MRIGFGLILALFTLITGCTGPQDEIIQDIIRIFWHESNNYTFYIQKDGSTKIERRSLYYIGEVEIFNDVPSSQKMWARLVKNKRDPREYYYLEIHIKSAANIEGGAWDHGKSGRGKTHVIR